MLKLEPSSITNHLLRSLSDADFSTLAAQLVYVPLTKGERLIEPDQAIQKVWFMESGVASVVLSSGQGHETEVGIVGREGMVDIATVHGLGSSPFRCFVQVPGAAYRLPVSVLQAAIESSADMRRIMTHFAYRFMVQVSGTAAANASFTLEQRLARWLLMCHDRVDGDHVSLTHEFLSLMLNVRRAGVTSAMQTLERAKLLDGGRGVIVINDRAGLESVAGDSYGRPEMQAMGPPDE